MFIVCISDSNIKHAGQNSTSLKICHLIFKKPVEMNIIGLNDKENNRVAIPVKSVKKTENSIFPLQEYDWFDIEERLTPLVNNVLEKATND